MKEALEVVKKHVEIAKSENKKLVFALILDEMNIRKQIIWDPSKKKYYGYVDYGHTKDDGDSGQEAGNALVFLVNAINGNFKIPIAYYLTDSSTADIQANIVKEILLLLSEIDADVISLSFDGARTNIKTAKLLGAEINNAAQLDGSFKHPKTGRPVQIFLDICHMLKLARNTLGNKGFLYDKEGRAIKWDYLVKLHNMQQKQGVFAANKL